jgi:hypothetical protein
MTLDCVFKYDLSPFQPAIRKEYVGEILKNDILNLRVDENCVVFPHHIYEFAQNLRGIVV